MCESRYCLFGEKRVEKTRALRVEPRVYPPVQYEATKAELMASYCTGGYIHLGGLDLMPAGVTYPTHTKV